MSIVRATMRAQAAWLVGAVMISSAPALGQPVTFSDLEGSIIETRIIHQRVIRREGREFPIRFQSDVKLVIGLGDKIDGTVTPTSHTARGARQGKTRTFSATLEQPRELKSLGGGHQVWVFTDGILTALRTYKGGAYKKDITFARAAQGFTCTAKETFAREDGVGSIVLNSGIDDAPVTIISDEQISSTCRVTKRN